jgi:hypothetical protein
VIIPLLPLDDDPEEKESELETPENHTPAGCDVAFPFTGTLLSTHFASVSRLCPAALVPMLQNAPAESAVRMLNAPLEAALPYPDIKDSAPPVTSVLSPELIETRPPEARLPLPTTMLMLPAAPFDAEPVRNVIIPLVPFVVDPDERESELDTPLTPAFAVRTLKVPLDDARPKPVNIETAPPVT